MRSLPYLIKTWLDSCGHRVWAVTIWHVRSSEQWQGQLKKTTRLYTSSQVFCLSSALFSSGCEALQGTRATRDMKKVDKDSTKGQGCIHYSCFSKLRGGSHASPWSRQGSSPPPAHCFASLRKFARQKLSRIKDQCFPATKSLQLSIASVFFKFDKLATRKAKWPFNSSINNFCQNYLIAKATNGRNAPYCRRR